MTKSIKEPKAKKRDLTVVKRVLHILMFTGSIAISAYFAILVQNPDAGQMVLAGYSVIAAIYHLTLAVK